jgi:hypothetical protein
MSIVLQSSSGGQITIQEPTTASNFTHTLPAADGTIITTGNIPAGSVLQVVQGTYATATTTTSTSFVDSGLSASITPTSSSSKILVLISNVLYFSRNGGDAGARLQVVRASTNIISQAAGSFYAVGTAANTEQATQPFLQILDSPATSSSVTYKLQFAASGVAGISATIQYSNNSAYITLMEIAA